MTADDPRPAGEACECGHALDDHNPFDGCFLREIPNHPRRCPCARFRPAASGGATDGEREWSPAKRNATAFPPGPWMPEPVASQADGLRDALRIHHPIMRSETGPLSGCRCGQVKLGEDVIAHVVTELRRALDPQ